MTHWADMADLADISVVWFNYFSFKISTLYECNKIVEWLGIEPGPLLDITYSKHYHLLSALWSIFRLDIRILGKSENGFSSLFLPLNAFKDFQLPYYDPKKPLSLLKSAIFEPSKLTKNHIFCYSQHSYLVPSTDF